jgi:protein-S-isoprenylcysteine O-methyltransferase Ste14
LSDSDHDVAWSRGFAGLWGLLAIAGAVLRDWGPVGLAMTFAAGFLAQEVRGRRWQRTSAGAPGLVAFSVLTAALGAAGIVLLLLFKVLVSPPWWVVVLVFAGLVALFVAGPTVARSVRARSAKFPASD